MSCLVNINERNELFEKLCDLMDLNIFVNLWSEDDDVIMCALLGGLPDCFHELDPNTWKKAIIIIAKYSFKWHEMYRL